jgi:dTDP-4-amino-4,6-dideoxygalactose transaminase
MKIPITRPFFDECESKAIIRPLESGWVVQGPYVAEFEKLFASFAGANFARATSSCTSALHLALDALGLRAGDKVVVPSFTYVASANAVEYTGAEIVFCDIDLETFNIDIGKLEGLLADDKKIKAVMPVHLFGLCAIMPTLMSLAEEHDIKVIEDSACGFDSWIRDRHSGTFGDVGCFSFHPRKAITTGEGGMLITDDEQLADKVSSLRDHGAGKTDHERHNEKGNSFLPSFEMRGYNYRMTDFQGAVGVCQMEKAKWIMEERRRIAGQYDRALKDVAELMTPRAPENYAHAYQSYVCIYTGGGDISQLTKEETDRLSRDRGSLMSKLTEKGIATRQGTHAVHTLGYFRNKYGFSVEDYSNSYAADRLSIALPIYSGMSDAEFDYVVSAIRAALK